MILIRYSVKSKPSISDEISKHNNCAVSQLLKSHLDFVIKRKITVSNLSFSAVQMGGLSDLKPVKRFIRSDKVWESSGNGGTIELECQICWYTQGRLTQFHHQKSPLFENTLLLLKLHFTERWNGQCISYWVPTVLTNNETFQIERQLTSWKTVNWKMTYQTLYGICSSIVHCNNDLFVIRKK